MTEDRMKKGKLLFNYCKIDYEHRSAVKEANIEKDHRYSR
jgi:hypothetical protein